MVVATTFAKKYRGNKMVKIDLSKLKFRSKKYKTMAKQLYGNDGFVIIKRFMKPKDVQYLVDKYSNKNYMEQIKRINKTKQTDPNNYHNFLMTYFYKNKKSNYDKTIFKYIKRAYNLRNKVMLQQESDLYMLQYCQKYNLDPNNLKKLRNHQFGHSFARIAWYRNGEGQIPHFDNPSEIQAIIFLTQKGKDYDSGGLVIHNDDGTKVDVDSIMGKGDLVLLNSYKKYHEVKPVKCKKNQIGRMHLFIPMIPDYLFKSSYFFKKNPNKLYFNSTIKKCEKKELLKQHKKALKKKNNKLRAIDDGKE